MHQSFVNYYNTNITIFLDNIRILWYFNNGLKPKGDVLMKRFLSLFLSIVIAVTSVVVLPIASQAAEMKGYTAVSSKEDFYNMRNKPENNYYLAEDIVFDSSDFISHGNYYNKGECWIAMDTFSGIFDGCGHIISGLVGNCAIAETNNGTIKNVTINDADLTDSALCSVNDGFISNCIMSNSTVVNGLVGSNGGNGIIRYCFSESSSAGITDYNSGGTIFGCCNASSFSKGGYSAGGIANRNDYGGIISDCVNKGDIICSNNSGHAGGIVGEACIMNDSVILNCTNYGTIISSSAYGISGGICGYSGYYELDIADCINFGTASDGGILGYYNDSAMVGITMLNCVNCGNINNGNGYALGEYSSRNCRITDSYYLSGSGKGEGSVLTVSQMKQQSNFLKLDFVDTWQITDEGISLQCTNQKQIGTAIYQYPSKTYYNVGEKLNVSDMLVMTFDNKGNWLITDNYTVRGFTGALGQNTVTVTAGGHSASFNVYVRDNISNSKITLSGTKFTATGKAIKPSVKVISKSGKVLKLNTDYTLTYASNTNPGTASVTIKGIGLYTGSVKKTFTIVPMQAKGLKVSTRKTTSLKLAWTKQSGVTGYVIQKYDSKNKKWKNYKTITSNTNSVSVTKLSAAATYKFRVRSYKTISGKKNYGAYSSVLTTVTTPNQVKSVKAGYKINNKKQTAYCKTTWKKQSNVSGYQLNLGRADFNTGKIKYYKTITVKGASKSSYQFKVIYASEQGPEYVRVRSYKTVNGKNYYGAWSKADYTY